MNKPSHTRRRIAVAATALLLLTACGESVAGPEEPSAAAAAEDGQDAAPATSAGPPKVETEPPAQGPAVQGPAAGSNGADAPSQEVAEEPEGPKELHVSMVDTAFEPSSLEIKAGEPAVLTVSSEGKLEHDFDLPAAGLHVHGHPGSQETVVLQLDTPGTYQALCLFPGHAEAGMVLDIIVS